jgi:hypothetical protein
MILDKRFYVEHLENTNGNPDQSGYVTHPGFVGGVMMNVQPASPTITALAEGELFKTFKAYTTSSGIVENFRLTASGTGHQYIVRGREVFALPLGKHYELMLVKAGI